MKVQSDEMSKAGKKFVLKAAYCDYNRVWRCTHKEQRGHKCTKICKHYKNTEL